mmetsp:Transcript_74696/g.195894  ORF Transcript_74696/g.195894 Transcript_74696/m.195894 type:complete len:226 (-) Transcript_74696:145-822(-)
MDRDGGQRGPEPPGPRGHRRRGREAAAGLDSRNARRQRPDRLRRGLRARSRAPVGSRDLRRPDLRAHLQRLLLGQARLLRPQGPEGVRVPQPWLGGAGPAHARGAAAHGVPQRRPLAQCRGLRRPQRTHGDPGSVPLAAPRGRGPEPRPGAAAHRADAPDPRPPRARGPPAGGRPRLRQGRAPVVPEALPARVPDRYRPRGRRASGRPEPAARRPAGRTPGAARS